MKKKILSLAIIMMSVASFSSMAQNKADSPKDKQECCAKRQACKPDINCKGCKFNPYEGLNLTDEQKTRLQQLDEKRIAEHKAKAKKAKAEKQCKDSVNKEARKDAKRRYLQEVKEIIGPDQYVIYLENMFINGPGKDTGLKSGFVRKMGKNKSDLHMKTDRRNHCKSQTYNSKQAQSNS